MRYWLIVLLLWCDMCSADGSKYQIIVHFNTATLELKKDTVTIKTYPVALPKYKEMPPLPTEGRVTGIEEPPWWIPTPRTHREFLEKRHIVLPARVPPGDPLNAMGAAKILIHYDTLGAKQTARIHGTNVPSSIGRHASGGCIRMHNKDILELVSCIRGSETTVEFSPT